MDNFQSALNSLPHGREFRFVDRLLSLEPGKKGSGEYLVRGDEAFLAGHFPGEPLFPGVLLLEAAAQVAGVVGQSDPQIAPLRNLRLTAMRNVKILGTARPGEVLRIDVEIDVRMGHLFNAKAHVYVNSNRILQGEVTLSGDPA